MSAGRWRGIKTTAGDLNIAIDMIRNFIRMTFLFSALFSVGLCTQGQNLHFSDIQSLYSADSAGFRSFCKTRDLGTESFKEYDNSYSIAFFSKEKHVWLSLSFGKDPNDSTHVYVLNYSLHDERAELEQFRKEIKNAGFKLTGTKRDTLPNDYTVEGEVYMNDHYKATLQTHKRNGNFFHCNLAYCRLPGSRPVKQ